MAYNDYEAVIGLEIHAQLKTKSKMFCGCSSEFGAGDNENTCPVCTGQPGALPTINAKAAELAVKIGTALGCSIEKKSIFARKNYFYPDMPRGYQISQYEKPICGEGFLEFYLDGEKRKVGIERAHLEEDAGKSTHFGECSLINLNRASTPLLEIVSKPEIKSPQEAAEYARMMRRILRYLDACDGNLEEGSMRCDCNVSIRKKGETELGTKVEIKNINSFRFVEKALQFEIDRQIDCMELGEAIVQETRLYDIDKNKTYSMRTKEDAADYRYFPDPDLLPLILKDEDISHWLEDHPELPILRYEKLMASGISEKDSLQITQERDFADYFEEAGKGVKDIKMVANWMVGELSRLLNEKDCEISNSGVSASRLSQLVQVVESGKVSGTQAKKVLEEMWGNEKTPDEIAEEKGWVQVQDEGQIQSWVDEVIKEFPAQVADYRGGKTKILGFLIGQVMKRSRGQAKPDAVNEKLKKALEE